MKKTYTAPVLVSEKVMVGVFGTYNAAKVVPWFMNFFFRRWTWRR